MTSAMLALYVALLLPRQALADTPAAPKPLASTEASQQGPAPRGLKRFAVAINPLGVAIGRYSIQGEYLAVPHHAVTLNPFFTHTPVKVTVNDQEFDAGSLNGFGGELGYRFYTSSKDVSGFFIGPSFLFARYSQSAPSGTAPSGSQGSDSFLSYGGAIDLGGQAVVGPGIVIGGGFGLQYTKTSKDIDTENLNLASAVVAGGGIRPRFLLSLGYSF